MNELQVFMHKELGGIRVLEIDGQPWFVGKDVAEILEYVEPSNAINMHVDDEDRLTHRISGTDQSRDMTLINESGLYSLILSSKLPKAKAFKRWVTNEVLPSIRKTRSYASGNETETMLSKLAIQMMEIFIGRIPVIIGETIRALNRQNIQRETISTVEYLNFQNSDNSKIETFPQKIQDMVDDVLSQMKESEKTNFSMVARLCTMQGCSISSPAVKKYYDKKFGNRSEDYLS